MGILSLLEHSKSCKCWTSLHFRTKPLYSYHGTLKWNICARCTTANAAINGSLSSARWEKTLGIIWKTIIVTNPCFLYIQAQPKDFSMIYSFHVYISPSNYSLIYFPVKGQSITPTHHFQGKNYLISLFSSSFQKGGFNFFSTSPTLELSNSNSIISKQNNYPNCSRWTNGDPQYADCTPRNLNCFPRIYCTFFKFLNHIVRSTEKKMKYRKKTPIMCFPNAAFLGE